VSDANVNKTQFRRIERFSWNKPMRLAIALTLMHLAVASALAESFAFPTGFRTRDIATNGATIHVRVGGSGPAIDRNDSSGTARLVVLLVGRAPERYIVRTELHGIEKENVTPGPSLAAAHRRP
jgi:hypothetical protein